MSSFYADKSQILVSALRTLEQTPPPSLREILNAYRAKGDGDRDMLLAMLNAKNAEDRRIAETSALHRTILESLNHESPSSPNLPPLVYPNPSQHPYQTKLPNVSTGQSYASKRTSSHSPPHHTYSPYHRPVSRDSTSTPPLQMPPSPYSAASNPDTNSSPKLKERGMMPIASMLSNESQRSSHSSQASEDGRGLHHSRRS
ncbi:hypothetical protein EV361DRAFT_901344 [Lentinula raphanica]|uniref:Uncharacterized protein n=1 Tax=Lentinula raphanica TaxID=153919 RepID=A0AA38UJG3_9AGAR|nr:hypothetical protein F5880DRAFT_1613610 [Lentinula raphanica]KAJ3843166.1 hypothetical protein F5878DRAFT_721640 [Lentinula raphanica]KAJ3973175.1 hypothetical protein EV361DRAFT_901344 [Lentinula raphanica]